MGKKLILTLIGGGIPLFFPSYSPQVSTGL